ncbi:MAG: hypothetical protein H7320_05220 [Ferruginibacter sp.]|nr:hypothetical protein [Ferruginibacter sp.]
MEIVRFSPLYHRNQDCIGIYCVQNNQLNKCISQTGFAKWSKTHVCWYMPCSRINFNALSKALSGKAILQTDALKAFLLKNSPREQHDAAIQSRKPAGESAIKEVTPIIIKKTILLCPQNSEALGNCWGIIILHKLHDTCI